MLQNSIFKNVRYFFALLALSIMAICSNLQIARAETTIVILINVEAGKTKSEAASALKEIVAYVGKQPNLVYQNFLESTFEGNDPAFVHLTVWKNQADWESMGSDVKFQELLEKGAPFFKIKPAEVFVPVK